ncbi:MAG: ATP-dependent 6-phosphofructokinase [candidate division Zixibacteria bacterium]|nr:ATP-dependent 6-phosphofructokinase [candidate division Zixibacteria bacterium]
MTKQIKTIGILTGGGDCPGLNAVIRAAVLTASNDYGWIMVGFLDGFEGLMDERYINLTPKSVRGILPQGGTILGSSNKGNPFEWRVKEDGELRTVDRSEKAVETLNGLGIDALIAIGGDGTMAVTKIFMDRYDIKAIGVPKTIDNDLKATEVTFGFATAVVTATEAIDKLHTTAASHHRAMVLEVMGRYVGWIALESGVAGGADVILIPEIPYDIDIVCDKIMRRRSRGSNFSIVVIAEGAREKGGDVTLLNPELKGTIHEKLGGVGIRIAHQIEEKTGMETRATVLGHLQRGGSPCSFDRYLGTRLGKAAVDLVHDEGFGRMICYRGGQITSMPIADAIGGFKAVDPAGESVKTAESLGVSFGR